MNELILRPVTAFSFKNAELTKISEEIAAQGNGLAGSMYNIAPCLARLRPASSIPTMGSSPLRTMPARLFPLGVRKLIKCPQWETVSSTMSVSAVSRLTAKRDTLMFVFPIRI